MKEHILSGLETDNLLGFLALLGLLRTLGMTRPEWFARAHFDGLPLQTILTTDLETTEQDVARAAAEGCSEVSDAYDFGAHADLNFSDHVARELQTDRQYLDTAGELACALWSDIAIRDDGRIDPTPLCAIFGQGHQHFLERLRNVAAGTLPRALRSAKKAPDLNHPERIRRAVFAPWERDDPTEAFRWDYAEDRRYALRATDPSKDAATTEHGANRLAIVGLLSFQSAPVAGVGGGAKLATRAVTRPRRGRPYLTWPIWNKPATLAAIVSMMEQRELASESPNIAKLHHLSVTQARRVQRISVDKFISFTRAEALF